jgi:hypothetical protein
MARLGYSDLSAPRLSPDGRLHPRPDIRGFFGGERRKVVEERNGNMLRATLQHELQIEMADSVYNYVFVGHSTLGKSATHDRSRARALICPHASKLGLPATGGRRKP